MVGTLISWSWLERRRTRGCIVTASWVLAGVVGLALALGTIWLGQVDLGGRRIGGDVLAAVLACWGLGWLVLPLLFGARETPKPEHLTLLPMRRSTVLSGLSVAALATPTVFVTGVAMLALVSFGARAGVVVAVVGALAAALQLVFLVVLSRTVVAVFGASLASRWWRLIGQATFAVVVSGSWLLRIPLADTGDRLAAGRAPTAATVFRLVPTGWGVEAVDAAARGSVLATAGWLLALAGGTALLWLVWARTLGRRLDGLSEPRRAGGGASSRPRLGVAGTPVGAVCRRELLAWVRDDRRTLAWFVAVCSGLALGPVMALAGVPAMLPFGGLCAIFVGTVVAANPYGFDGSGIWIDVVAPDSARPDVRGRQLAWLAVIAPVGLLLTVVPSFVDDPVVDMLRPWVAAALPTMLGVGAGAIALTGALAPYALPQGRVGGQLPFKLIAGPLQFVAMSALATAVSLGVLVPLAVVLLGVLSGSAVLTWAGVPVGVVVGAGAMWMLGRPAMRVVERREPEILRTVTASA